jgi:septum formation protein
MEHLGLPFEVRAADVDEGSRPGEQPRALVGRLSRAKAQRVAARHAAGNAAAIVIGADTIVTLEGELLGKPADAAEAAEMLARLRDRPHQVYSGVTVVAPDRSAKTVVVESTVWMRAYGDDEIAAYVAGGSPLDKAGAYGIQDASMNPVARLAGCYASVMGLPLCALVDLLRDAGLVLPDTPAACSAACRAVTGVPCCAGQRAEWTFVQGKVS